MKRPGNFILAALALAACLLPCQTIRAGEVDVLVYSHFANAGPLNPHLYTPNQMYAQEMLYEPLVATDKSNNIVPCLATSWDISDDGKTYIFHLRTGVTFSDGHRFDASAVVRNFDAILANRTRHAWLDLSNKIDSYRAVDVSTFELVLTEPYYPVLSDLSLPRPFRFISPAAIPDSGNTADGIRKPSGTGPWILAETVLGVHDVFKRNETYWGDRPHLDSILVKVIPDPVSRAMALRAGEVDLIYGVGQVPYDIFDMLRRDANFTTDVSPPMGGMAAALNTDRTPTDELPVRRAVQHLVDKDALVAGVFLNSQPKADFLFSPSVPYCDIGLEPYAFDPVLAGRLLDEAGWTLEKDAKFRTRNGKTLSIEMCYIGNDAGHKAMAEAMQGQAAKVGLRLVLVGEEEDSFLRRQREGDFGIILNPTWGPPFEPHAILGSMRFPSHADYRAQLGLPMKKDLDAAVTKVLRTRDEKERARLYKEILSTLHEQAVYLPIHYFCLHAVYRKGRITGFEFGPGKTKYPFERLGKGE